MCGRFSLFATSQVLMDRFDVDIEENIPQRYNISPSQESPVVLLEEPKEAVMATGGLVPFWAKDKRIGNKMINARSESIDEKPAFRHAFKKQRCLVLADGFYEWRKVGSSKQPFRFHLPNNDPFAFAGVYDRWEYNGKTLLTFSILTTDANKVVKPIHERMPVVLERRYEEIWLDPQVGENDLKEMLHPYPGLLRYAVSRKVNSPANDSPDIIEKIATL